MKKWMKITLLCLVILINILLAYQPHFNYPYPLLTDEYNHISFGKHIVNEHKFPFTNPYLAYPEKVVNLESGFHFFLAATFLVIPGEPVLYYKYFIILFMIINSLLLFYLVMLWFKNYYSALLSVLFYGTIKSTGDLLVHNYFLPLTMGITLLLLSFIFFYKWENSRNNEKNNLLNKYLIYLIITVLITILTYPPTLTFLAGVIFLYILSTNHEMHEKFNLKKRHFLTYFAILSAITIIISIVLMIYLNLTKYFIFPDTWTPIKAKYSPIFFFGIIPSIFAFLGLWSIIKEHKNKIILYWLLFSIIQIYLFYIFKFNILVPFARLFVFYLIGLTILAGMGVVFIFNSTINYFNKNYKNIGYIKLLTISLILILILANYYFIFKNPLNPPHIIDDKTYDALQFIKNNYHNGTIIIADSYISHAVYPITQGKILGIIGANLGGGFPNINNELIYASCKRKKEIMDRYSKEYLDYTQGKANGYILISNFIQNCDSLEPIYEKGPYLYKVKLTD